MPRSAPARTVARALLEDSPLTRQDGCGLLDGVRRTAIVVAVAALELASTPASGHPLVDAGRARLDEADFRGAIDALRQAEAATDLSLADLEEMLEVRALVLLGLGDAAAMEHDLLALATIAPSHRFTREAPPEVHEAFDRIGSAEPGRVAIEVELAPHQDVVVLQGRVLGDPAGLVRELRLYGRTGAGTWRSASNGSLRLPASPGVVVEYRGEAIGPGGAVLARAGSPSSPLVERMAVASGQRSARAARGEGARPRARRHAQGSSPWPWIGAGAAAVVVAAVVTALAVSSSGAGGTRPTSPSVQGF